MSSRHANSLMVEFVNGTSSSTLRFFHRTGLLSSQRKELKTLLPPSGESRTVSSFVFRFEKGTNEFIEVEYKVEVENENGSVRQRTGVHGETYKRVNVRIDSATLRDHSKITVVDSEAAQNGAAASSRKMFKLQAVPRPDTYEAGWLLTLLMTVFSFFKYILEFVSSAFRNSIRATQTPAAAPAPPAATPELRVRADHQSLNFEP